MIQGSLPTKNQNTKKNSLFPQIQHTNHRMTQLVGKIAAIKRKWSVCLKMVCVSQECFQMTN